MEENYARRFAVRALIICEPEQRVLLIRTRVPNTDRSVWLTPGGGIEANETHEQALAREVYEETGLRTYTNEGPVWTRRMKFKLYSVGHDQSETIYLLRAPMFEPDASINPAQEEKEAFGGFKWWSLAEIQNATDENFAPLKLAEYLDKLLIDGMPDVPFDVGR